MESAPFPNLNTVVNSTIVKSEQDYTITNGQINVPITQMNNNDGYRISTKTYTMTVRYANGTGANSTQGLAYNSGSWSSINYPPTAGWGQFGSVNVNMNLTAGDNIIRIAKGNTGYAELDYIEIN